MALVAWLCCLLLVVAAPAHATFYYIKNLATNEYLSFDADHGGLYAAGRASVRGTWRLEEVQSGGDSFYLIGTTRGGPEALCTGTVMSYVMLSGGRVQGTERPMGAEEAYAWQWEFIGPASGADRVRIRNREVANAYLHKQFGEIDATEIRPDFTTASWQLVAADDDTEQMCSMYVSKPVAIDNYTDHNVAVYRLSNDDSADPELLVELAPRGRGDIRVPKTGGTRLGFWDPAQERWVGDTFTVPAQGAAHNVIVPYLSPANAEARRQAIAAARRESLRQAADEHSGSPTAAGGAEVLLRNTTGAPIDVVWIDEASDAQEWVVTVPAGNSVSQSLRPGMELYFVHPEQDDWLGDSYVVSAQPQQAVALPYTAPPQQDARPWSQKEIDDWVDEKVKAIVAAILQENERPRACWRETFTRGAGLIPDCGPNQEADGLLCYSKCSADSRAKRGARYSNVAGVCWQDCPTGFRDDGAFCRKAEYGRGAGYGFVPIVESLDDALRRCRDGEWGKEGNEWMTAKNQACETHLLMAYPRCKPGYEAVGCCICAPSERSCAKAGLGGEFLGSCTKHSFVVLPEEGGCKNRTPAGDVVLPGHPLYASSLKYENDAGLCYPTCNDEYANQNNGKRADGKFTGVGPVCWSDCPSGYVNCGASCAKSSEDCLMQTSDQVFSPLMVAANTALIALTAGGAAGATAAANTGKAAAKTGAKAGAAAGARQVGKAAMQTAVKSAVRAKVDAFVKAAMVDLAQDAAFGGAITSGVYLVGNENAKALMRKALQPVLKRELEAALLDEKRINTIVEMAIKGVEEQSPGMEFPWESLDPTGIAEVVVAYNIPMCHEVEEIIRKQGGHQ